MSEPKKKAKQELIGRKLPDVKASAFTVLPIPYRIVTREEREQGKKRVK